MAATASTRAASRAPGNPLTYKAAYAVSYNRPFHSAEDDFGRSWLTYAEYPMIRFLEANGYDVSYMSSIDVDSRGPLLQNHRVFVSAGHDEYWTENQRSNVEAARDSGVNLAFFSGNLMFWKTRLAPSIDGSSTPLRTIVSYKDTHFDSQVDPVEWTGTWRDPRSSPPSDGGRPENALTGTYFLVNTGTSDIRVPQQHGLLRLWRNTAAATLAPGQTLTLGPGMGNLGYEWDTDVDNGFRPPGLFRLSSTTVNVPEAFYDYGSHVGPASLTHNMTLYKAASGALVFSAGTVQWSWGLDNAVTGTPTDRNMRQATVNLFADMGVQPATLTSGLVAAAASTDLTPPTSVVTAPANGATIADGTRVTVTGTAGGGGGVVAGVEVSTDGGTTWHPASGTSSWSYSWVAHGSPTSTIRARAVDDSGNLESPGAGVTVSVSCPCSIWGTNVTPAVADSGDPNAVEVGVRFTSTAFGTVTGLRFYKSAANTGTHVGNLWTEDGQLLASVTFTGETGSGWQQATFSSPVPILPGTTYVASYSRHAAGTRSTPTTSIRRPRFPPRVGRSWTAPHCTRSATAVPRSTVSSATARPRGSRPTPKTPRTTGSIRSSRSPRPPDRRRASSPPPATQPPASAGQHRRPVDPPRPTSSRPSSARRRNRRPP